MEVKDMQMTGLKAALRRIGSNQDKLAKAIGVDPTTVSRWVKGHTEPSGKNLLATLEYLRSHDESVSLSDILERAA